jgi:hypothetical protein
MYAKFPADDTINDKEINSFPSKKDVCREAEILEEILCGILRAMVLLERGYGKNPRTLAKLV